MTDGPEELEIVELDDETDDSDSPGSGDLVMRAINIEEAHQLLASGWRPLAGTDAFYWKGNKLPRG